MKKLLVFLILTLPLGIYWSCNSNPYWQGEILYNNHCANCHMEDGSGLGGNIPPLAKADYLETHREQLGCIVRYGIKDTIVVNGTTYHQEMLGVALKDVEIANVLNYVFHAWGNDLPAININELEAQLQACEESN